MSSTFHIACLSHDPAVDVTDLGHNTAAEAEDSIRAGINGHADCDLVIVRWSGAPVEFGCPGHRFDDKARPPAHWCRSRHAHTEWIDGVWLHVLAHARMAKALPEKVAKRYELGCWTGQRIWRLRHELDLELPPTDDTPTGLPAAEGVDEPSPSAEELVHPAEEQQASAPQRVDDAPQPSPFRPLYPTANPLGEFAGYITADVVLSREEAEAIRAARFTEGTHLTREMVDEAVRLHTESLAAEEDTPALPEQRLRAADFTARHWHQAAIDRKDIPSAHAIGCILAALKGETRPDELGLDDAVHDEFRAALKASETGG
ncbi:hypothetical protein [Streptomyces sp. NBC_00620]|uniref:hypothetical protein n=1 Tax=Streptomyces sp. NBC_00620 TaxID=2903666 RepID=UPI0022561337|nr:hypothetical protein [Streptomyces sp. NBC_00620]MCX4974257.1 hypothetical protein [Streptomyces sp. NBC_00620]